MCVYVCVCTRQNLQKLPEVQGLYLLDIISGMSFMSTLQALHVYVCMYMILCISRLKPGLVILVTKESDPDESNELSMLDGDDGSISPDAPQDISRE